MRAGLAISLSILLLFSCRTQSSSELQEAAKSEGESKIPSISPPFASGEFEGIKWSLRFNRAQCQHAPEPSTFCLEKDRERVAEESGIEATLLSWIRDKEVKSIRLSYFTFGSSKIANALCEEAASRALSVEVYLQSEFVSPPDKAQGVYKKLLDCSAVQPSLKVFGRGSKGWLNHAKIFFAESEDKVRVTSSSANLSGSGISLHYDNWIFLELPRAHPVALANRCFFDSLKSMLAADGKQDKNLFQKSQNVCPSQVEANHITFLTVPAPPKAKKPIDLLLGLIQNAKTSITIAAHKITSPPSKSFILVPTLVEAIKRGVKVRIVFDDDTILKARGIKGSEALNVSPDEIAGYKALKDAGAEITFLDTNEKLMTLMHNKFMIFDETTVFTGAGNFSSASLTGKNTEQFYILSIADITTAYLKAWNELRTWSFAEDHFTKANSDEGSESPNAESSGEPKEDE